MHKGKLHKININNIWIVECSEYDYEGLPVVGQQYTIYPGPLPLPEGMSIDNYLYEGHEIDFVLISEEGMRWAKPIIPRSIPSNGIPTAEEFVKNNITSSDKFDFNSKVELVKKFAKLHLEAQAKAIYEKAKINVVPTDEEGWEFVPEVITYKDIEDNEGIMLEIDEDSILNAYPLNNVK